ncbi:MAG: methionine adenosyltransferase [Syntrophales bacterium]|nr:methionine adenosyltransferase [Syntrophales bacterium]
MAEKTFYTSESVTEGHPDKVADQIADAVLDSYLEKDPGSRVAVEVMVTSNYVLLAGEVTSRAQVDVEPVVRRVIKDIGYVQEDLGFDYLGVQVEVRLHAQSPDIALGVDSDQARGKPLGAGDQGIMYGYACDETEELMPLPIMLAHQLARRLAAVRQEGTLPYLRPDGKTQVTVEYVAGRPARVEAAVVSAQHSAEVDMATLRADLTREVIRPVIPPSFLDERCRFFINPTGRFVIGGPHGDTGATGRKSMVDTYGGLARHGGGSFSGKDPTKVDRSASYTLRHAAKSIVAAGLSRRCELQAAYVIGEPEPVSLGVETFGSGRLADPEILALVQRHFDLTPAGMIAALGLQRPIYRATAVYGHFGRHYDGLHFPWEAVKPMEFGETA